MNKIAVVGMPRTASKMVLHNLSEYMKIRHGHIPRLISAEGQCTESLDEFLNHKHEVWFLTKAALDDNNDVVMTTDKITNTRLELCNRIDIIRRINTPVAMKHFPFNAHAALTNISLQYFDKVYYLTRRDVFNHALSFCISMQTNQWSKCMVQNNVITDYVNNKRYMPIKLFTGVLAEINIYNRQIVDKVVYNFEDLIKLDSSSAFCSFFGLEFTEFEFINNQIEYGDNKVEMISNLDELRKIYNGE